VAVDTDYKFADKKVVAVAVVEVVDKVYFVVVDRYS
jgi:hypothetical protein